MIASKETMNKEKGAYRSYLLRLWQVKKNGDVGWRASLEEAGTQQRHAFTDLDDLFRYLAAETAAITHSQQEEQES